MFPNSCSSYCCLQYDFLTGRGVRLELKEQNLANPSLLPREAHGILPSQLMEYVLFQEELGLLTPTVKALPN